MLIQFNWYVKQENIERLLCDIIIVFSSMAQQAASGSGLTLCSVFTITFRHTTLGRTPLDEWSPRCRDCYLSHMTHNIYKRQTFMPHGGVRTHNPSRRAAALPRRRRRRHLDRLKDWWVINVLIISLQNFYFRYRNPSLTVWVILTCCDSRSPNQQYKHVAPISITYTIAASASSTWSPQLCQKKHTQISD